MYMDVHVCAIPSMWKSEYFGVGFYSFIKMSYKTQTWQMPVLDFEPC